MQTRWMAATVGAIAMAFVVSLADAADKDVSPKAEISAATSQASQPASTPSSQPAAGAPAATGTIKGVIVDSNGKPVAGADVSVFVLGGGKIQTLAKTKTAKNGTFSLEGLAAGKDRRLWAVFQVKGGPALIGQVPDSVQTPGLDIAAGKTIDVGTITIAPATM